MDEIYLSEASRTVSYDKDGPVDVKRRLVQEEIEDALVNKDINVRARLIDRLAMASGRTELRDREATEWIIARQAELREAFHLASKLKRPPPDVMHPEHVRVAGNGVSFRGPIERSDRETWEHYKAMIKVAACTHEIIRSEFRRNPTSQVGEELRAIEAWRRKLMRRVPKGWNWREEIYCRHSMSEFTADTIRRLKEIGYARPIED